MVFFSSNRKEKYKEFMDFTDTEPSKILKHSSTRWLSLEKCVNRLLEHWPALLSYFNSHDDVEKPGRVKRCAAYLRDHEVRLYYHFLSFILQPLNDFNTMFQVDINTYIWYSWFPKFNEIFTWVNTLFLKFQADESRIGYLQEEMKILLRKFMGKFVRAKVIQTSQDLTSVPFNNSNNQLQDNIIAIGPATRAFIVDNEEDISPSSLQRFFM